MHPETPRVPYTPGWDLVGIVDQFGEGVTDLQLFQMECAEYLEQLRDAAEVLQ